MISKNEIGTKISLLRNHGRVITNSYTNYDDKDIKEVYWNDKSLIYTIDEDGVHRLYFYTTDLDGLQVLLSQLSSNQYTMEFMSRGDCIYTSQFDNLGFVKLAEMHRFSNRDCGSVFIDDNVMKYYDESIGNYAALNDTEDIYGFLHNIFDTRISHLQDRTELKDSICNKEYTIHKNSEGKIDALLQVVIQPKKFYINQAVNCSRKGIIHTMLINRLKQYYNIGGGYVYSWIEKDNTTSIRWHKKFGLSQDGLCNEVYILNTK